MRQPIPLRADYDALRLRRIARGSETLESHFKMFLGTTPLSWVRRMRLARARQELIRPGPKASVTDAASASLTSERSYQTASSNALNIASGGQAGSPLLAG